MTIKSSVTVTYRYECSIKDCGVVDETTYPVVIGNQMWSPMTPIGWHSYFGMLVCPKHKLTLCVDDGEEFTL